MDTKICSKCGSENSGTDKFCVQCGAPLDAQSSSTQQNSSQNTQNEQQTTQQTMQQNENAYTSPSDDVSTPPAVSPTDTADSKKIRRLTVIAAVLGAVILILVGVIIVGIMNRGAKDSSKSNAQIKETVTEEAATEKAANTPSPTSKPTASPTSQPSSSPDVSGFPLGSVSGNTYENNEFGFGMTLDGWTFMSRDQIDSMYNTANAYISGSMSNEGLKNVYESIDKYFDMLAYGKDGKSNINVVITKNTGFVLSDETAYMELVLSSAKLYYEQMGMDIKSSKVTDVSISDKTKAAIVIDYSMLGNDFTIVQLVFTDSSYVATVTVTAHTESEAAELCKKIYTL